MALNVPDGGRPLSPSGSRQIARRLSFRQLDVVRSVAESGSVRAAAQALHLSAPAVSKALAEVEALLRFPLFERLPRGMAATPRGERFVAHARLLVHELDLLVLDAASEVEGERGLIRIGASPYAASRVLPTLLPRMRELEGHGHHSRIQVRDGRLNHLIELLLSGEIDALLTIYAREDLAGVDTSALVIDVLRDEALVVFAPPGMGPATRRRPSWAELAASPWILPPHDTRLRRVVEDMFYRDAVQPPKPIVESANLDGNVRMAAAGIGMTVAPVALGSEQVQRHTLHSVFPRRTIPNASLALIHRRVSGDYLHGLRALKEAARGLFD